MDPFYKLVDEILEIEVDFSNSLATGETVENQSVVVYLNGTPVNGIYISSSETSDSVFVKLENGLNGSSYVIEVTATTSASNVIIKNVIMEVVEEIPVDTMLEEIKILGNLEDTEDKKIKTFTRNLLDAITHYCNNDFIAKSGSGKIYEQKTMSMSYKTLTLSSAPTMPLRAGDYIRLYNTSYNDGLYRIISVNSNIIIVDVDLRTETNSTSIIALVDFPKVFSTLIKDFINSSEAGNIKSEKIDDTQYTYAVDNTNTTFFKTNASIINCYRNMFPDRKL